MYKGEDGKGDVRVVCPTSNFQLSTQGPYHTIPYHTISYHTHTTLSPLITEIPFPQKVLTSLRIISWACVQQHFHFHVHFHDSFFSPPEWHRELRSGQFSGPSFSFGLWLRMRPLGVGWLVGWSVMAIRLIEGLPNELWGHGHEIRWGCSCPAGHMLFPSFRFVFMCGWAKIICWLQFADKRNETQTKLWPCG